MGEGRRDRSSKRQLPNLGIGKSSSDTEVDSSRAKNRKRKKERKWHFTDGLSVDELGRYRRRRVQNHPRDTLGTCEKSGSRENLVTEYRRAYRATSEDSIFRVSIPKSPEIVASSEEVKNLLPPQDIEFPSVESQEIVKIDDSHKMETTLERSQDEETIDFPKRPPLMRRGTSLKREGDEFYGNTEYSTYVSHEGHRRPELARRPTSLRMEGEIDGKSEQCEKFIEWLNVSRPAMIRLPTNLKLEGDLETATENLDNYVPFVGARRPELLRQRGNLKLEGESTFLPEYTDVFRVHNVSEKRLPVFPETNLHTGGNFYGTTETSRFNNDPMDNDDGTEEDRWDEESTTRRKKMRDDERRRKKEDDMRMLVSKLEDLKGPPMGIAEYKDAYKDFPRERPKLMRPEDEIGRADGSKIHRSPSPVKFTTKIDQDPEYNTQMTNMDRPIYRKPPLSMKPSGSGFSFNDGRSNRDYRSNENATSEIRSQFVHYGNQPRVEIMRMPTNLRLEGSIDLKPEYRDAYCTRRDENSSLTTMREPRMHRHRDRSLSATRRRDNLWITNNNGEQFGSINAADQQDAFQVLNTRIHADGVIGKPPLMESRRGSRMSQMPSFSRPTNLGIADSSPTRRKRSPSPVYRLHVQNVDDEPHSGFVHHRRGSLSRQLNDNHRSQNSNYHDEDNRRESSYSPSFGRGQQRNNENDEQQAFVVLENSRIDNLGNVRSSATIDRNINPTGSTRPRPRDNTPTNWMAPWYDNTKTN